MKILLTTISSNVDALKVVVAEEEDTTFGRLAENRLNDGYMSKVHFKVTNSGGRARVENLSETNPVLLNGNKILKSVELCDGDKLQAGKTVFLITLRELSTAPTPPPVVPAPAPHPKPIPKSVPELVVAEIVPEIVEEFMPEVKTVYTAPPEPQRKSKAEDEEYRAPNRRSPIDWDGELPGSKSQIQEPKWAEQIPTDFPNVQRRTTSPVFLGDTVNHYCMELLTSGDASVSFGNILEMMSRKWCIELVLHFQKIRQRPPENASFRSLFHWQSINDQGMCSAPIAVSYLNLKHESTMLTFVPRLCRSDACIAFIGTSSDSISKKIDDMLNTGAEGFSEQGGFLPCCWPSGFATIIDCVGNSICDSLFGDSIVGAYFCAVGTRKRLIGVGNEEFTTFLKELQFKETLRIFS